MVRLLLVSLERKVFEEGTASRARLSSYGAAFEQVSIVVPTLRRHGYAEPIQIASNVWVYPTDSIARIEYILDVLRIVKRHLTFQGRALFEVVSTQDPYETGLLGFLIAWRFKRKLHLQIHTDILDPFFRRLWGNKLRLLITRFLLARAAAVRVVTPGVKSYIEKKYSHLSGKVTLLPVYVDLAYLREAEPKFHLKERYKGLSSIMLMVCRLSREKDVPLALRVLKEITSRYPKTGLVIVGDGPERAPLMKEVRNLELENNVRFEGWQDELVSYYKTADILLHTSRYEGYGMTLVEAAVCGLPIVTSEVGIASELDAQGRAVSVCKPGDISCFVTNAVRYMYDPERKAFARLNVEQMPENIALESKEKYLALYKESIEQALKT